MRELITWVRTPKGLKFLVPASLLYGTKSPGVLRLSDKAYMDVLGNLEMPQHSWTLYVPSMEVITVDTILPSLQQCLQTPSFLGQMQSSWWQDWQMVPPPNTGKCWSHAEVTGFIGSVTFGCRIQGTEATDNVSMKHGEHWTRMKIRHGIYFMAAHIEGRNKNTASRDNYMAELTDQQIKNHQKTTL